VGVGKLKKVEVGACVITWKSIQIMICWSGEYVTNGRERETACDVINITTYRFFAPYSHEFRRHEIVVNYIIQCKI
jgi:hypothetical protein